MWSPSFKTRPQSRSIRHLAKSSSGFKTREVHSGEPASIATIPVLAFDDGSGTNTPVPVSRSETLSQELPDGIASARGIPRLDIYRVRRRLDLFFPFPSFSLPSVCWRRGTAVELRAESSRDFFVLISRFHRGEQPDGNDRGNKRRTREPVCPARALRPPVSGSGEDRESRSDRYTLLRRPLSNVATGDRLSLSPLAPTIPPQL